MASDESCAGCGATVYPEHLASGIAKKISGKVYCSHCAKAQGASDPFGAMAEPISFETEGSTETKVDMSQSRITMATDNAFAGAGGWDDSRFKRPLDPKGTAANRCRVFHSKIAENAIAFMTSQINDWLDSNKDITVKHFTSNIGPFEGKHVEQNLIITVFY
ncbi:MAG: hypothetical protein KJ749_15090 [Planctomycetes bacterium]|nr:hypothetical protein [Planctomycetota bacterium]